VATLFEQLDRAARELATEELPGFVGALENAKAAAWQRLAQPPAPEKPEELITAVELAPVLKLPVHAVRDRARRGVIPCVRIGHYVRFQVSAVLAALKGDQENDGNGRIAYPGAQKSPSNSKARARRCPPSVQTIDDPKRTPAPRNGGTA